MSLFRRLEALNADRPWGTMLDAGTGPASMRWMTGLGTSAWAAVTGAGSMAAKTRDAAGAAMRPQDRLLTGNWTDDALLAGERFDTVLADYLLGAIEGFAPYWQDQLFVRLRPLVGGRLYVVGLDPYVPGRPPGVAAGLANDIGRLRDACLLLSNGQPYREYPLEWTLRHLQHAGFRVLAAERVPIRLGARFVDGQLDMCTRSLARIDDPALAAALSDRIAALRARAHAHITAHGGIDHGHDYIVVAEPV